LGFQGKTADQYHLEIMSLTYVREVPFYFYCYNTHDQPVEDSARSLVKSNVYALSTWFL